MASANACASETGVAANNKLVFLPSGRFGNALFRYMACAMVNIINPALEYTLLCDFNPPLENFTYYPGLDHEGGDLYKAHADAMQPSTMQKEALQDSTILGFNTLGYFKQEIDHDKLVSNLYINKENGQGLYVKNTLTINDDTFFNMFYKKLENFNVCMDGFFQFGYIYLKYKPQILDYMHINKASHCIQTDRNEKYLMCDLMDDCDLPYNKKYTVAIHIRLDDFNGRPDFIEIEHYLTLFATLLPVFTGQTICIVYQPTDRPEDQAYITQCVQWFQDHQIAVTLESNSILIDFNIMKQATTLICSMSTLSWMAAYLSQQIQTCYMPNYNFCGTDRGAVFFHQPIANTILYPVKTTPQNSIACIKPHIITLPQYSGRLAKLDGLNQQLATIGLDTTIFQGVYGKDIKIYDAAYKETGIKHITWQNTTYFYDTRVRLNGQPMAPGELGCSWSHLNLLRKLANEVACEAANACANEVAGEAAANAQAPKYYLVFEDDVELVKPLSELYELLQHIPADADMCHLAKSLWNPFVKTKQVNDYFYECEKRYFSHGTAYLISAKGAQKVLDYTKNAINVPADDLYNMVFRLTPDFRFYVPAEHYFKEQDNVSLRDDDLYKV
jgi:GR25 family glycosyltransferase involved in LPS biosynthesis